MPAKVPQPHGGALLTGGVPGNKGGGRPPDEIRQQLRELGAAKGVPFLNDVLDGTIKVRLIGTCEHCQREGKMDTEWVDDLLKAMGVSVKYRLAASEQALKYGLASKELVIASGEAASFFDCVYRAIVELHGEPAAEAVKARAVALMDAAA